MLLILLSYLITNIRFGNSLVMYAINTDGNVVSYKRQYNLKNCKYDYLLYTNNTLMYYCESKIGRADVITSGSSRVISQNLFDDYYYNVTYSIPNGVLTLKNKKTDMVIMTENLNDYVQCLIIRDNLCY